MNAEELMNYFPNLTPEKANMLLRSVEAQIQAPAIQQQLMRNDKRRAEMPTYYGRGASARAPHWMEAIGTMFTNARADQKEKELMEQLGGLSRDEAYGKLFESLQEDARDPGDRYQVAGKNLFDTWEQKWVELPESAREEKVDPVQQARDIAAAKDEVKRDSEEAARLEEAERKYAALSSALDNLDLALEETSTGPILGSFPAFGSDARAAEGAIAAVNPMIVQMYRVPGDEMTERETERLLSQVPNRNDPKEARKAKIANLRSNARLHLGLSPLEKEGEEEDPMVTKYADM